MGGKKFSGENFMSMDGKQLKWGSVLSYFSMGLSIIIGLVYMTAF